MRTTDLHGLVLFHYPYKRLRWRLRNPQAHKNWLRSLVKDRPIMRVDYYFVPLEKIILLHGEFASATPTDIITLELSSTPLWAEIYISPHMVKQNSRRYGTPFPQEMRRTLVHGLLHLLGYQDDTPENREAMRRAEDRVLMDWEMFHVKQKGHVV